MIEDFDLSKWLYEDDRCNIDWIKVGEVSRKLKEFIRRLKRGIDKMTQEQFLDYLDKIAGEKLR